MLAIRRKESELSIDVSFDHVYVGCTNSNRIKAIYEGTGKVTWSTDNPDIIKVNSSTGLVTGVSPGQANVIATAGKKSASVPVYCVYKWEKAWTGSANSATSIKSWPSSDSEEVHDLPKGTKFVVGGDDGFSDGWAYGCATIEGSEKWGFVRIEDISTKGTVSQYNSMGFLWPVDDDTINYISSPFGPRSSKNGGNHKGFDITTGNPGEIAGEKVVATFTGTIKRIYIDNNKATTHGNSIVITTDKIDPVSGKNITIIYMHLLKWETDYLNRIVVNGKIIKEGDSVETDQVIGHVGNTGSNTSGAHLHYEVNNQNAAIRSGTNNPFTETINPQFFYKNKIIDKSSTCEAANNGNGFYWYGEND